jgi:hypothetical protein
MGTFFFTIIFLDVAKFATLISLLKFPFDIYGTTSRSSSGKLIFMSSVFLGWSMNIQNNDTTSATY